jgi:sugar phosphate permease
VFVVSGVIAALIFGGAWYLLKDRPQDVGLAPPEPEADAPQDAGAHPLDDTTLRQACLDFVRSSRVWLICLSMAFLTILMDFLNFIPIYLTESMGLDPAQAGRAGSFFPAGMFVALLVSSVYYDRIDKRRLVFVQGGLLTLACASAAFLWLLPSFELSETPDFVLSITAIFLFGFAISPAYYLPMSMFSIAYGGPHSGFLIAVIDVFGYAGALLFNYFGGSIAQEHGWPVFLGGLLIVAVLALVVLVTFLRLDLRAAERPLD